MSVYSNSVINIAGKITKINQAEKIIEISRIITMKDLMFLSKDVRNVTNLLSIVFMVVFRFQNLF